MRILPINNFYNQHRLKNTFKSTVYEDKKIVEKDIFSINNSKSLFTNPISPNQEILGVNLEKTNDKINMYSRYGNLIGMLYADPNKPQPQINLQVGSFQPIVELKDDELGITILLTRGGFITKSPNIDIRLKPLSLSSKSISFGHNLVITTGYKPEKTKEIVENYQKQNKGNDIKIDNYYINKLKNNYTIVGLGGGYGTRLKPISDLAGDNKLSTPYPGNQKTLFDIAVMDTATRAGKIDSIKYINDDSNKLSGTAGVIIKGLNDGTINPNKPLVLLTGDTCNNINLAKALYDFEQSPHCGIGMIVTQLKEAHNKSCVKFDFNKNSTAHNIIDFSEKINHQNQDYIKEAYSTEQDGVKKYYTSTNAMIIAPEILKYLKDFASSDGTADYMQFFGLMFNVLNKTSENLKFKYPHGIPSANLDISNFTDYLGYPNLIYSNAGYILKVKAIIAKDINGNDAISEDVGTVEDYIRTIKDIKNNDTFGSEFTKSLRNNIDENGIFYFGQDAKSRLEEFKKKYKISDIYGNVIVYAEPRKKTNPSVQSQQVNTPKYTDSTQLHALTKNETVGRVFINTIMNNPQNLQQESKKMIAKYGLGVFLEWYTSPNGYYGHYEKYMDDLYKDAGSIDELLKFTPGWAPWKLEEKAWRLNNPHLNVYSKEYVKNRFDQENDLKREYGFEIGTLPSQFGSKYVFENLVHTLKTSDIKEGDVNGFSVKRLKGGELNDKFIYLIEKNNDYKKYILKFDRTNVEDSDTINGRKLSLYEKKNIRKNKYLAADSIYSNACVSKYLELNDCQNIPKMYYYNQKENAALYEYIADAKNDLFQSNQIDEEYEGLMDTNKTFKALNNLGIYLNDTAIKNTLTGYDGIPKIIDLGHANFIMPFKPGVKHYNIEFSNINGPDMRTILASVLNV